ncbi:hypothetical protein SAMN05216600_11593 [Pseudomonas cuatrocienegasensis]|uniref:Uncharacterized protein n=1 Tax=Pseudomonas cuatrocienegasensis TaxID=543360 RepID=A0ABY1BLK7_9PSED|nr:MULTISPECIES: hypothetical protein [Pseudomonas]SER11723.1 hypothetical protein SAMN05216600_11593 [Pseudomonas cuatrocienegasensis]
MKRALALSLILSLLAPYALAMPSRQPQPLLGEVIDSQAASVALPSAQ